MPNTDYDEIGHLYAEFGKFPINQYAQRHTFLQTIGDVKGKDVLDIACGHGINTRIIAAKGAKSTYGVDISPNMIERATEIEKEGPLGIRYAVADASTAEAMQSVGLSEFDVAIAAHYLVYAENIEQLRSMVKTIHAMLRPGGRFVQLSVGHPYVSDGTADRLEKYGFKCQVLRRDNESIRAVYTVDINGKQLEIENTLWPNDTLVREFESAGFKDVEIRRTEVDPQGYGAFGGAYWREATEYSLFFVLSATKQ